MNLYEWAIKWGIPFEAVADLRIQMGTIDGIAEPVPVQGGRDETAIGQMLRFRASQMGGRLFRNNVGASQDHSGRLVRYGLANDSAKMNKLLKSSDLIGIKPVTITPEMVGQRIGQFWAREVKIQGWYFTGTDREIAQQNFINLILSMGGDAAFTTGEL